jgi:hypothetical protein
VVETVLNPPSFENVVQPARNTSAAATVMMRRPEKAAGRLAWLMPFIAGALVTARLSACHVGAFWSRYGR